MLGRVQLPEGAAHTAQVQREQSATWPGAQLYSPSRRSLDRDSPAGPTPPRPPQEPRVQAPPHAEPAAGRLQAGPSLSQILQIRRLAVEDFWAPAASSPRCPRRGGTSQTQRYSVEEATWTKRGPGPLSPAAGAPHSPHQEGDRQTWTGLEGQALGPPPVQALRPPRPLPCRPTAQARAAALGRPSPRPGERSQGTEPLPSSGFCSNRRWRAVRSRSDASNSVRPYGLAPARLLCPWDSPGKKTGVGCHALLQGIFPTQASNPHLLHRQEHHQRSP